MLVKTDIGAASEALQQVFQPRTDIPATNTQQAIELVKAALASALGSGFIVDAASSDLTGERVATDTATIDFDATVADQARWNVLELPGIGAAGIVARTGAANYEARTIAGTTNEITATDGDGVAGNPTLSFPTNIILTGKNIDEVEKLGINTTADTTNRLSVNSDAVLFNHNGTTSQIKANKAATGDTASHLFQVGFSGRAEFGLIGSDDFQMKTSPDGSAFTTGLTILSADGALRVHIGIAPSANDGAALGTAALGWADAFFATGGTIRFANTDWVATHSAGILTVGTGDLRVTTAGTNAASVVTVGGAQTLTNKALTSPDIDGGTLDGAIIGGASAAAATVTTLTVNTNANPDANDGAGLGTGALGWSDLFLASGGVINWNAGNYTITHSAGDLAFSGIVTLTNTGLHLLDTNASHDLIIAPGSNLTADRTLTVTTGDTDIILNLTDPGADRVMIWDESAGEWVAATLAGGAEINGTTIRILESFVIACSDETTNITTGTAKVTFRMPYAFTLTGVRASVNTAPTGSTIIIDINEGTSPTTILSTKLSIDAGELTSVTAASAAVISDTALADDAHMTIDFDQVGSSTPGKGVKVVLLGYRP